ncbi:amino acid-binding protein [Planosporangium flavigriseum]|uniref:Amino acid-binding protein n=1 Tax=Planosporangium flavigriseum TaxID=373681 RepID=A0A8J3LWG0_9ACTN|nr:amino acid-binding protein [Planosporangium flavigriseum]NJC63891.1 amino acid-binding protein [Planosporangium flavigriseum]GIG74605.1 amino acid-binding protein [Planosporangium flavigriseum]
MLLRLRVSLPDRPGSLGQVARTLGVVGADIVQVVVLERVGGRAVDDFAVVWPAAAPVDRVLAGLAVIPGVRVDGAWRTTELPDPSAREVAIVGQIAANPAYGLSTLVDAAPGVCAADWAAVLSVPRDWASVGGLAPDVLCASLRAPEVPQIPDIAPLRPRAMSAGGGTHLAVAPFHRGGLVLAVARGRADGDGDGEPGLYPPPFHRSEVDRLAQFVDAVAVVLGDRLTDVTRVAA